MKRGTWRAPGAGGRVTKDCGGRCSPQRQGRRKARATKHKTLAASYRRSPASGNPRAQTPVSLAAHCESIATEAAKADKEARIMAEHHRMVAMEASAK
jgi:hypothetical protein